MPGERRKHDSDHAANAYPGGGRGRGWSQGHRLTGRSVPAKTRCRSLLRMCVCVPAPERDGDQGACVRWPRLLVGDQTALQRPLSMVANWDGSNSEAGSSPGAVVVCGWKSGNRGGAGVAQGELKKSLRSAQISGMLRLWRKRGATVDKQLTMSK